MAQSSAHPLRLSQTTSRRPSWLGEPQITAFFFLLPALIIFSIFVVWPVFQSARYSVYEWNGLGPLDQYVGTQNYQKMADDPIFWRALKNNTFVVVWSFATQIPLAIFLAIILTGKIKGTSLFRTVYFAPMILSEVIVATIWSWIYNPTFGMLNTLLRDIGLEQYTQLWLSDESLVMISIMIVTTWKYLGFYLVLFIAAIQGISDNLYEAAQIDGANGWQIHRHITLPLLVPTTRVAGVLVLTGSLKFFDMTWVLTEGGPANASQVLATYMFKQSFRSLKWGYGSALAFTLFAIAFVISVAFNILTRQRNVEA